MGISPFIEFYEGRCPAPPGGKGAGPVLGHIRPPHRRSGRCENCPIAGQHSPQLAELGAFLKARRAEIAPADVGLPDSGRRRVKGLRREEVAMLASISTDYYARIEQGRRPAPEAILDAIARVLRLDRDERDYAFELARASAGEAGRKARRRTPSHQIPAGVQALLDAMVAAPAVVHNGRLDLVSANALGRALFASVFDRQPGQPNLARFVFLDAQAPDFYLDWEAMADAAVAILRVEAGHAPYSKDLTDLIGELATRSEEFKSRWAAHHVHAHRRGTKRIHHAVVGDLTLQYEALEIPDSGGLTLFGYTAEPGSASEDALKLLGSWAASGTEQRDRDPADKLTAQGTFKPKR